MSDEADAVLLRHASRATDTAEIMQRLQAASIQLMKPAALLLGRKPKGFPIAVPIHFKVIDDEGNVTEMQYFVVMEVPYREAASRVNAHIRSLKDKG